MMLRHYRLFLTPVGVCQYKTKIVHMIALAVNSRILATRWPVQLTNLSFFVPCRVFPPGSSSSIVYLCFDTQSCGRR